MFNYVFVADTYNYRIVKRLASDLSFVSKIGTLGSGDDQFDHPYGIAVSGDYVYVADTWNHRIVKRLASDLTFVSKIGTEGSGDDQFEYPVGIAVSEEEEEPVIEYKTRYHRVGIRMVNT